MAERKNKDPLIGKTLGNYKILRELGRGGMGVVYRGEQVSMKRDVAIKVLSLALAHDRSFVKRFVREGRIAGRLTHPNIVTIYDVGQQDGTYFIAMEYVRGKSLDKVMKAEGQFEVEKALKLTLGIAEALAEAHKHGIIHRDIKPQNVMLTEKGNVKVMDFGLARGMASTSNLTATGAVLGTPTYMSPEQCRGEEVAAQTDIYSLGVVLFEMLAGRPPYKSDSPLALMLKTVEAEFPVAGNFNGSVTSAVDKLVADMVAKEARKRYASADAVAAEIERIFSLRFAAPASSEAKEYNDSTRFVAPNDAAESGGPIPKGRNPTLDIERRNAEPVDIRVVDQEFDEDTLHRLEELEIITSSKAYPDRPPPRLASRVLLVMKTMLLIGLLVVGNVAAAGAIALFGVYNFTNGSQNLTITAFFIVLLVGGAASYPEAKQILLRLDDD